MPQKKRPAVDVSPLQAAPLETPPLEGVRISRRELEAFSTDIFRALGIPETGAEDMLYLRGGGLLPLGGEGTAFGGYKGYGLAVMVDILCALTSGGAFGSAVRDSETTSARVCHFFLALRIDLFREPAEFRRDLSRMLRSLGALSPAEGADRVYYAGLKSRETEAECARTGVPVAAGVWASLVETASRLGVTVPPV
ncbi:MAG: Ldh family oxidoreductase [Spirochaetaceae bacterium]|jgi:LDH2 family malate/lactate/ureidoglycolate dehydrogenase|nr:Ldh family oxidoreductase [Spirochaetaceae bacterium]